MVATQEEEAEATTTLRQVAGPTTRLLARMATIHNNPRNINHRHTVRSTQDNILLSIRSQVLAGIPRLRSSHHNSGRIRDTSTMPRVPMPFRLKITIQTTLSTSITSSSSSRLTVSSRPRRSSSRHMVLLHHSPMGSLMPLRNSLVVPLSSGVLQLLRHRTLRRTNITSLSMEVVVAVEGITIRPRHSRWDHPSGWGLTTRLPGTPMLQ